MASDTTWVGGMPETYDRCLGPALFAPYASHLATLAEVIAPDRVLELAAGTGILTRELVRSLPQSAITATDLNPAMVDWARGQVPGPHWQPADAQALPYPDHAFDLVVCQFGAMFFPDKRVAYAEAARVLAPGGQLLLAVWDVVEGSTFTAALVAGLGVVLPENPPTFVARVPHGYHRPEEIMADLGAAGFESITVDRVVLPTRSPSAAVLAEGFCRGTPLRFALEERGPIDGLTAAIAAEMTARLGAGPVTGELAAFVVSASPAVSAKT